MELLSMKCYHICKIRILLLLLLFSVVNITAQNQLPIENGNFEILSENSFLNWNNTANNGGNAIYSIETNNLISGSNKALKSEVEILGSNDYDVGTKSSYGFEVESGEEYTVSFYAKTNNPTSSREIKVVFQSETPGSFQGTNITLTTEWERYVHTFIVPVSGFQNKLKFWYLNENTTYYLDEVSVVKGSYISLNTNIIYQTVDGFGAGIKRKTEDLYALSDPMREAIESYCFKSLEANMIRFFIYHTLEPSNDNLDPSILDESSLDWTRYESSGNGARFVAEALNNAFSLSNNGFSHVIGNCNSAPGWLKTNGQHYNGGTLIPGGESEYSEFLVAFLNGMKSRYDIDVNVISPTNEPDFEVSYESMNTTPNELSSILSNLKERLQSEELTTVKIMSPECFRVSPSDQNPDRSTTYYVDNMFANSSTVSAIDIIATHTYQSPISPSEWSGLLNKSQEKPIWVTEAGNLHSPDWDMTDASYHISRILNGFNFGGLTAYMYHLFYEQHKYLNEVTDGENFGSSALVLWDSNNNIILPKRYYTFKHFANLIKPGYRRINHEVFDVNNILIGSFSSPTNNQVVTHLFNESSSGQSISLEVPIGTTSIAHYITSDSVNENFSLTNDIAFKEGDRLIELTIEGLSMHSVVYNVDQTLSSENLIDLINTDNKPKLFPNPTNGDIKLKFNQKANYTINIYNINGINVFHQEKSNIDSYKTNLSSFSSGVYFVKINSNNPLIKTNIIKVIKN
jgi:O-glycosyl hydrolase